jgi:hypothetical protein
MNFYVIELCVAIHFLNRSKVIPKKSRKAHVPSGKYLAFFKILFGLYRYSGFTKHFFWNLEYGYEILNNASILKEYEIIILNVITWRNFELYRKRLNYFVAVTLKFPVWCFSEPASLKFHPSEN